VRVLFDVDVVLDLLLDRSPFSRDAGILLSKAEQGELTGHVCATAVTTLHYISRKTIGDRRARKEVRKLLTFLEPLTVNRAVLEGAFDAKFRDFEDAVSHEAARQAGVECLVTRNIRHFKGSQIPVYSPSDLVRALESAE
jgi:predicted nucleic acid-binding protein